MIQFNAVVAAFAIALTGMNAIAEPKAADSTHVEADTMLRPPAEPRGMLASSPSGNVIALKWTDRSGNEDDFIIERKTNAPKHH